MRVLIPELPMYLQISKNERRGWVPLVTGLKDIRETVLVTGYPPLPLFRADPRSASREAPENLRPNTKKKSENPKPNTRKNKNKKETRKLKLQVPGAPPGNVPRPSHHRGRTPSGSPIKAEPTLGKR